MSGQYPPPVPNPAHPYSRPAHHQRTPPPWGHPPQPTGMNMVGSMNFYGSPHLTQPWAPRQTHPKPCDTNPLYGLQMLMSDPAAQRLSSDYQQEETMDLSSHSSTADVKMSSAARPENTDGLLRNGAIPATEVNGDVEAKERVVTSVIAANALREDALNCSTMMEKAEPLVEKESVSFSSRAQMASCVTTAVGDAAPSGPVNSCAVSLPEKTSSVIDETITSDRLGKAEETPNKVDSVTGVMTARERVEDLEDSLQRSVEYSGGMNESQTSYLDSSSLSMDDTDDSKLVVAELSADDIFGMCSQPSDNSEEKKDLTEGSTPYVQETLKIGELIEKSSTVSEPVPDKIPKMVPSSSNPSDSVPTVSGNSEPHPSVENVEILLESMFNSQEETSCSSQNSSNGVPQSVIVSNGVRVPSEVPRPAVDILTTMKEEDLAMTLAEDTPMEPEVKEEQREEKVADDLMDEIEKKLEMLTESGSNEVVKSVPQPQEEPLIFKPIKEENSRSDKIEEEKVKDILTAKEAKPVVEEKIPVPAVETAFVVPVSESGTSSNPFIEVESELEKMFAGIVETTDETGSDNQSQLSVSEPKKPAVNKRTIAKRKNTNAQRPSDNSIFGNSSIDSTSTPIKKKGRKRTNDSGSERGSKRMKVDGAESLRKGRVVKDASGDGLGGKVKGPFVHIEGSKESPASVVVVNSGVRLDDEDGIDKAGGRRKHSTVQRSEGGSRRSGPVYSSSTLSMRYNSDTADLSWVCVFCKRGPHWPGGLGGAPAGDLFGPYRIAVRPPVDEAAPPGTPADKDVVEEQKRRGGKHPKSLRTSGGADQFVQRMTKKGKRSLSSDSCEGQPGLLPVEGGHEVWLHGSCAEWAPGLCIIGTQLVGLDDAVWTAIRTKCTQCGESGAGLSCVVHNCPTRVHYHCAIAGGWLLDSETFIARCHAHRTRPRPSA